MSEEFFASVVLCLLFGVAFVAGHIFESHSRVDDLHSVGIEEIVHHKTVVDGVVATNWSEIVWKEGYGNGNRF